jgi:hypothetical protein
VQLAVLWHSVFFAWEAFDGFAVLCVKAFLVASLHQGTPTASAAAQTAALGAGPVTGATASAHILLCLDVSTEVTISTASAVNI